MTTLQQAPRSATTAATPGSDLARVHHLLSELAECSAQIHTQLRGSNARAARLFEQDPTLVRRVLRQGAADPLLFLALLAAASTRPTLGLFDGDMRAWCAANTGHSLKDTHRFIEAARFLYLPSQLPLPPEVAGQSSAAQTAFARQQQAELRALIARRHIGVRGAQVCIDAIQYIALEAKHLGIQVLQEVFENAPDYPAVKDLQEAAASRVQRINRRFRDSKPPLANCHLRFSRPDANGMVYFTGRCTADMGAALKDAVRAYRRRHRERFEGSYPQASLDLLALYEMVTDPAAASAGKNARHATSPAASPKVAYQVGVVVSASEFEKLCANPRLRAHTDRGGKIRWDEIVASKPAPLDWVAIIGSRGVQIVENPDPNARFATSEQRRIAAIFNPYCAYPGCRVPAAECEAHHVQAFSRGGETVQTNLALVCRSHHSKIDDSHQVPGRFHLELDDQQIAYVQYHPNAGEPLPPRRYNRLNLERSAVFQPEKIPKRE